MNSNCPFSSNFGLEPDFGSAQALILAQIEALFFYYGLDSRSSSCLGLGLPWCLLDIWIGRDANWAPAEMVEENIDISKNNAQ